MPISETKFFCEYNINLLKFRRHVENKNTNNFTTFSVKNKLYWFGKVVITLKS